MYIDLQLPGYLCRTSPVLSVNNAGEGGVDGGKQSSTARGPPETPC